MNDWILVCGGDGEIVANASEMLSASVSRLSGKPLPSVPENDRDAVNSNNVICIGRVGQGVIGRCESAGVVSVPAEDDGYSIFIGRSIFNCERQMICIAGRTDGGVLYGCADLCNRYFGDVIYRGRDLWCDDTYDAPFSHALPEWSVSCSPAVKTRAVWTWGHVIYDYRGFFRNMARLRLNEIVIWNDHAPLNADAVVDFAHSLGIKVIWGFSWGWSTSCRDDFDNFGAERMKALKAEIIARYTEEYANIKGDGIYFQSFTEFGADREKGRRVAETVTELVNVTACELLSMYPDLHIQFGLHATSVKDNLDVIARVDPRIYVVWEDCGAFPYAYDPSNISRFEETEAFTEKLLSLRGGNERFGAVLKGMLKLDWTRFEHSKERIVLGERDGAFIRERQIKKNRIWKIIQSGWLKNAGYAARVISLIAKRSESPVVEALIEDALLENRIMFPAALYAELLWDPDADVAELIGRVAKYPCVCFANTEVDA